MEVQQTMIRFRFILFLPAALLCANAAYAQQGYLKTRIDPTRAGVFIDGKYVGPSANFRAVKMFALSAGEHEVKLVEPRYQEVTKKVTIEAGKTTTLVEKMTAIPLAKPPFGRLRVNNSEKFAAVYVNGKFMGHGDEFNGPGQGLLLPPGEYDLKVVPVAGGNEFSQKVKIEADKVLHIHVK